MLVDANLLLFAVDRTSPWHRDASAWLSRALNGSGRVGLPWESLTAFLRISTNPRAARKPLSSAAAWSHVRAWLDAEAAWVPQPTERHAEILGNLVSRYRLQGNLIPDAHLAAVALEHGLTLCSSDTDFARFTELRWENPLA